MSFLQLAMAVLLPALPIFAQSQANTGQIVGFVRDTSGLPVAGATVKATSEERGAAREIATGSEGEYRMVLLPPGNYQVEVLREGFSTPKANVTVTVGSTMTLNIDLTVAQLTESLTVSASPVEADRAEAGTLIDKRAIEDLPINGRRFHDFVTLTPTAIVELRRGGISLLGQKGINTALYIDGNDYGEPFFGGMRGTGLNVYTVPQSSIAEFQVITAGYSPEFGGSTGGVVTAITRNGTNEVHGSAFYLLRHHELGKRNALGQLSLEDRHQYGAAVGGPLRRDKLFYFGSFEQQYSHSPRAVLFPTLASTARTSANAEAWDFYKTLEGPFRQTNDIAAGNIRVDHQLSARHQLSVRFAGSSNRAENAVTTGEQIDPFTNTSFDDNGTIKTKIAIVNGQLLSVFTPSLANDLRIQYSREKRPRAANGLKPTVTTTVGTFGVNRILPSVVLDSRTQISDSLNWQYSTHAFKLGGEFHRPHAYQEFGFNQSGFFSMSLADVNETLLLLSSPPASGRNRFDNTAVTYARQVGNLLLDFDSNQAALFFQDNWRIHRSLTLNYGLRWEGQYLAKPDTSNTSAVDQILNTSFPLGKLDPRQKPSLSDQVMPRFGFAWSPGDAKTVIRGSVGIFYARTPLVVAAAPYNNFRIPPGDLSVSLPFSVPSDNPNASQNTLYKQLRLIGVDLNTTPLDRLPVISPDQLQQLANALGISYTPFRGTAPITWSPNFKNPRALQWTGGIEREVAKGTVISANFFDAKTVHLARNHDYNLPVPVIRPDDKSQRPFYGLRSGRSRPNAFFGTVLVRESSARSLYRAATFGLGLRKSKYQVDLHYTLATNYSDDDNERDADINYENSFNLRSEYNYSELDARHFVTGHALVFLPFGLETSATWRLRTALPLDASTGADSNQDLDNLRPNPTDRPYTAPGTPVIRNSFRNLAQYNADLRVLKSIPIGSERARLEASFEMFNIFNFENVSIGARNKVYGVGIDSNTGSVVAPPASFRRVTLSDGRIDPNNSVGTPLQLQMGLRFIF